MQDQSPVADGTTSQTTVDSLVRFACAALLVLTFSVPAIAVIFPGVSPAAVPVSALLTPIGVYLMWRLYPRDLVAAAVARLMLPTGVSWVAAGVITFTNHTDLEADPYLMAGGAMLLATGFVAAAAQESGTGAASKPRPRRSTTVVHLYTRVIGLAMICVAIAVPILADAYPAEGIVPAPISLGLIASGALLATRPFPHNALAALAATVLLPAGSIWFLFGALAIGDSRGLVPNAALMTAGGAVLVVATGVAWTAWGSRHKSAAQVVFQGVAVVVWIATGTASVQAMAEPLDIYIEPIAMELDGSKLVLEIDSIGPCGTSFLSLDTAIEDEVLKVTLTRSSREFDMYCMSSCLSGVRVGCSSVVEFTLAAAIPPGTTPVATPPPATGLLRVPLTWLIGGIMLGAAIFLSGRKFTVASDQTHDVDV